MTKFRNIVHDWEWEAILNIHTPTQMTTVTYLDVKHRMNQPWVVHYHSFRSA